MLEWKPKLIVLLILLVALAAVLGQIGWAFESFQLGW
jgi:hypothetical protein